MEFKTQLPYIETTVRDPHQPQGNMYKSQINLIDHERIVRVTLEGHTGHERITALTVL
ncbi:hypothetical protein CC2G_008011 [Coprinopsis cinerea AmutBmut pab1-1]|nr:hypothetical protein CC2G_008011 [Coprinopsis cinerea AmutBmut pab1-1]